MRISIESMIRSCAVAAVAMVLGMIAIFFARGVGQDPLQFVHPPDEYARILLRDPPALRACLGLDNGFIAFYTATFVGLALVLARDGAPRALVGTALGTLLLLGLLDMFENFHFMTMLASAAAGAAPSAREIALQVWESLLKFHVGYVGVFLLGFALPRRTPAERALSFLTIYVQLPVGILIYVTPPAVALPLVFVRFSFFVAALSLVAVCFGRARLPVGSGAPA